MLKRVSEVPASKRKGGKEPWFAADLREFARNRTYDVAELVPPEGIKTKGSMLSCYVNKHIKQHRQQMPDVLACCRGNKVYLYREEKR
jgi:hypothetical protein